MKPPKINPATDIDYVTWVSVEVFGNKVRKPPHITSAEWIAFWEAVKAGTYIDGKWTFPS